MPFSLKDSLPGFGRTVIILPSQRLVIINLIYIILLLLYINIILYISIYKYILYYL